MRAANIHFSAGCRLGQKTVKARCGVRARREHSTADRERVTCGICQARLLDQDFANAVYGTSITAREGR